jgi:hypothetical protein
MVLNAMLEACGSRIKMMARKYRAPIRAIKEREVAHAFSIVEHQTGNLLWSVPCETLVPSCPRALLKTSKHSIIQPLQFVGQTSHDMQ